MQPCAWTLDTDHCFILCFFQVYPEDKQLEWNVGRISMEIRKADNDDNVDYFYHRLHSCRMSLLIP